MSLRFRLNSHAGQLHHSNDISCYHSEFPDFLIKCSLVDEFIKVVGNDIQSKKRKINRQKFIKNQNKLLEDLNLDYLLRINFNKLDGCLQEQLTKICTPIMKAKLGEASKQIAKLIKNRPKLFICKRVLMIRNTSRVNPLGNYKEIDNVVFQNQERNFDMGLDVNFLKFVKFVHFFIVKTSYINFTDCRDFSQLIIHFSNVTKLEIEWKNILLQKPVSKRLARNLNKLFYLQELILNNFIFPNDWETIFLFELKLKKLMNFKINIERDHELNLNLFNLYQFISRQENEFFILMIHKIGCFFELPKNNHFKFMYSASQEEYEFKKHLNKIKFVIQGKPNEEVDCYGICENSDCPSNNQAMVKFR